MMMLDGFVLEYLPGEVQKGTVWNRLDVYPGPEGWHRLPALIILPDSRQELDDLKRLLQEKFPSRVR